MDGKLNIAPMWDNPRNINYTGKQEDVFVLHVTNAVRGRASPTFLCYF